MFPSVMKTPVLVCQLSQKQEVVKSGSVSVTSSLLTCLSEATSKNFGLVIIAFSVSDVPIRNDVLELCRCMNSHPLTRNTPILAFVGMPHRSMAAKMADVGVRFMAVHPAETDLYPEHLMQLVQKGDASIRMDRILARLCPFLYYRSIDDRCELTTCRAYSEQMVLAGIRLHEVCETEDHLHCEYFLNPRIES